MSSNKYGISFNVSERRRMEWVSDSENQLKLESRSFQAFPETMIYHSIQF